VRSGDRRVAIADRPVSRADYARFVAATGRPSALCRQRGSLLRIVAPRSWNSPGFEQAPQQPVVCVSWQDAHDYARWLSQRDGRRYRLAGAQEAQAAPAGGSRAVATWADACGATCAQRLAAGSGWRGGGTNRVLEGNRGYDDVGFRLVREL
jgi:serine/threonine-protein kinase PpkA